MKVYLYCTHCSFLKNEDKDRQYEFELTDNRVFEFKCNHGHENIYILQNKSFELLFEMGLCALNDGYSREAATNFAAAIERFHEFCITVMVHEHGVEHPEELNVWRIVDRDYDNEYKTAWNTMVKQSERQYEAYIMLYLITFKRSPTLLDNKYVKFRNNVTHNGIFPTRQKTLDYGKAAFEYIQTKLIELRTVVPKSMDYVYYKEFRDFKEEQIHKHNGKTFVDLRGYTAFRTGESLEEISSESFEKVLENAVSFRFFKS